MITDIGHPAFACHDVDATLRFYALLGVTESFRLVKEDGSLRLIYLQVAEERFLELFPGDPAPREKREATSYRHLCLLTSDLHGAVEHLRAAGVTIDRQPLQGLDANWQAWIRDPDGNDIELLRLDEMSPQRATIRGEKPAGAGIVSPAG
ncbi:MAG: VOC family protein [Chloroflexota bacterium]|nr:VOC family protein [Chloroflexota bacterium]